MIMQRVTQVWNVPRWRTTLCLAFGVLGILAEFYVIKSRAERFENTTASMPRGSYFVRPAESIATGMFVVVSVPKAMQARASALDVDLPRQEKPQLLKVVIGTPGERYFIDARGIHVDGLLVAHSKPLRGLPLAPAGVVPPGFALVWTPVPQSLDSRYLGPLEVEKEAAPAGPLTERTRKMLQPEFLILDQPLATAGS